MEHGDCNMHCNRVKLGIICCCVECFMVISCAFMEMGKERCFVSLDLECELSRLYVFWFQLFMRNGGKVCVGEKHSQG